MPGDTLVAGVIFASPLSVSTIKARRLTGVGLLVCADCCFSIPFCSLARSSFHDATSTKHVFECQPQVLGATAGIRGLGVAVLFEASY